MLTRRTFIADGRLHRSGSHGLGIPGRDSGQGHGHHAVTERFERHQARSRADDGEPSFDHFLGWLPGADGRHDLTYLSTDGNYYPNYRLAPDFQGCGYSDPDHSWEGFLVQHNFGKMDGFLQRPTAPADNPGVTLAKANTFPIGYYTNLRHDRTRKAVPDLPVIGALAEHYTVLDRYFLSACHKDSLMGSLGTEF